MAIRSTEEEFSSYQLLFMAATLLLPASLLLNLGLQPLMLEEPRRALIAMELAASENVWVPTLFGELYYNKPPVFNWLLLLSVQLFGGFNEWALRFPTVLSLLLMGLLTYGAGRRYVGAHFGWVAALLTICSVDFLFYFSMLAEIDLFYSLVSFAAILSVFHFFQAGRPYALFLSVYGLTAVGFLNKGLPSILFAGITITLYLGYKRAWKWLFSVAHLTGILLFFAIAGAYFLIYAQYEDPQPFLLNMWYASSNRSVLGESWMKLPVQLVLFPLDTLKNVLPATLLLVFGLHKNWWRKLWQQELLRFAALAFAANFLIYWVSPGSRQRYIYMLFPFLILIFTSLYRQNREFRAGGRFLKILALLLCAILAAGSLAIPLLPQTGNGSPMLSWWAAAPLFAASAGLLVHLWRRPDLALPSILILLAITRILFDLVVLPQRAKDSNAGREREWALQVDALAGETAVHLVKGHRAPFTFAYYLNLLREAPLQTLTSYRPDSFYLLENLEPENWQTMSRYEDKEKVYYFGRFTEPPPARLFREREHESGILREF
jgi:4-amino-4-deoxy-L-arabinose transferase-like glycosyltransferase